MRLRGSGGAEDPPSGRNCPCTDADDITLSHRMDIVHKRKGLNVFGKGRPGHPPPRVDDKG